MPTIQEDSLFFIPVGELCHRSVVTCSPDIGLVEMARQMKTLNVSGIVVVENEEPIGIVSIRDLRDLIADFVNDIPTLSVRDIMKTNLITIGSSEQFFKAVFLMAKHTIHHLVVLDQNRHLSGILSVSDLLRIQTKSPLYLVQEIESATTLDQLCQIGKKRTGLLQYAVKTNADTRSMIQLIALFNDSFTERLIHILDIEHGVRLPRRAAYLVLGSEGRCEQALRTDQDSAIVYSDEVTAEELSEIRLFADHIVAALEQVGIPLCPGNMMASNPDWCHSISEWKTLIAQWIGNPTSEHTVYFGVFQDLRVLYGELFFEEELRTHISDCTRHNPIFFPGMALNIIRFKPPIGMFGRLRVATRGAARGTLDLKKGGIFTLTRGIGLLALEAGIMGGTTWDKLEQLQNRNIFSDHDLETLKEAFTFLIKLRLEMQLTAIASGKEPSDLIDPLLLPDRARDLLRTAFQGVTLLNSLLSCRYQLDIMAR